MGLGKYNTDGTILYISYTGLLEPLGESQVLNYLVRLSDRHTIMLCSFEKPEDLADKDELKRLKRTCNKVGIEWIPLKYHKNPRLLATLFDMFVITLKALSIIKKENIKVMHCRGYIPTFAGLLIATFSKTPFIFDMRAFWPDEMVTAGRLQENSIVYRLIKKLEIRSLQKSDCIVTLTQAAARYLIREGVPENKIETIPTCVDLDHFPLRKNNSVTSKGISLGVIGTVTGWFQFDWVLDFFSILKKTVNSAKLRIVSRDDKQWIYNKAKNSGVISDLEVYEVSFQNIPAEMHKLSAGIFFYKPAFSELARSPTKMGEFLASGVPCISNPGIGDVATIINKYNVGVLVDNNDKETLETAVKRFQQLLKDPDLPARCRQAAEEWFSLEKGVEKYNQIYNRLM